MKKRGEQTARFEKWCEYSHIKAPPEDDIVNAANQTLQRMARKWGVNKKRKVKTYLGRFELSQLID